ncbi:MAG: hypothetical protein K1X29_07320 [Bdellovibrionales bacterium]|nr:hypothetical protein [Bdellovibrionales bacterium]
MRWYVLPLILFGGMIAGIFFNNCSSQHSELLSQSAVSEESSLVPCSYKDEMDLFSQTYHKFTTSKCAGCHVEGGVGKGAFASSGLMVAYNSFVFVGYEKLSGYAIDSSHNPPYTGIDNIEKINLLRKQWVQGLENISLCEGGYSTNPTTINESDRLELKSKPMYPLKALKEGEVKTFSWSLSHLESDLIQKDNTIALPQLGDAKFMVDIKRTKFGGKSYYVFYKPRLVTDTVDIYIKSILIKLNGRLISLQTTFKYIDAFVRKQTTSPVVLAPGAMIADEVIIDTDLVSISIGTLEEALNLPPPEPPSLVRFSKSDIQIKETIVASSDNSSNQNLLAVELQLSPARSADYVTATVAIENTNDVNAALNRRSMKIVVNNKIVEVDRWDWDYQVDTLAVVFAPGETKKNLIFKISNDQRIEPRETINLKITSVTNAVINQTDNSDKAVITIIDDDAPNVEGVPTFSSLMQPGGVLFENCFKCHNSVDNRGGYNLSDYDLMIANKVLIPSDVTSKMFVRMNAEISGLRSMPLLDNGTGSLLEPTLRKKVEVWIKGGARND